MNNTTEMPIMLESASRLETETWAPTMNLRQRVLSRHAAVIEQQWVCIENGKTEWRGIPIVGADGNPR